MTSFALYVFLDDMYVSGGTGIHDVTTFSKYYTDSRSGEVLLIPTGKCEVLDSDLIQRMYCFPALHVGVLSERLLIASFGFLCTTVQV